MLPGTDAEVFGNIRRRDKFFASKSPELFLALFKMAFSFPDIILHVLFIIIREVSFEFMGRDKPRTYGLFFQDQFRQFGIQQGEYFLIVVFSTWFLGVTQVNMPAALR